MALQFPQVSVGQPVAFRSLSVFPLFVPNESPVDYHLSEEAITDQSVVVEEVGEEGSVPDLIVENKGECRVLFLEGEELRGAKQNRILNTSVMVAKQSRTKIPVSCVEQGRWRHTSKHFASTKTRSPSSVHYAMKSSVTQSLKRKSGHRSDQSAVWEEVDKMQASFCFASPTSAMSDTFDSLGDKMAEFHQFLKYPEGASGMAIALGDRVVSFDLFDKPATCRKAWERLLSGHILDALGAGEVEGEAVSMAVEDVLNGCKSAGWDETHAVGEGKEYRMESNQSQGSALLLDDSVVHMNVMMAP